MKPLLVTFGPDIAPEIAYSPKAVRVRKFFAQLLCAEL